MAWSFLADGGLRRIFFNQVHQRWRLYRAGGKDHDQTGKGQFVGMQGAARSPRHKESPNVEKKIMFSTWFGSSRIYSFQKCSTVVGSIKDSVEFDIAAGVRQRRVLSSLCSGTVQVAGAIRWCCPTIFKTEEFHYWIFDSLPIILSLPNHMRRLASPPTT